jgi:hypothetical protein
VGQKETPVFEIAAERARCISGLNFFLLSRSQNRGYWIGPVHPAAAGGIALNIEKYAGLSTEASMIGY